MSETGKENDPFAAFESDRTVIKPSAGRTPRPGANAPEAANAPLAVQATKRVMRRGLDESFEANVHHVFLQLLPLFRSDDFREGISAYLEKCAPQFQGR